jgi:hypothetical protein
VIYKAQQQWHGCSVQAGCEPVELRCNPSVLEPALKKVWDFHPVANFSDLWQPHDVLRGVAPGTPLLWKHSPYLRFVAPETKPIRC